MSCKLNNLSKLTWVGEPWLTLLLSDYNNIIECMFWTLPPRTVARPGQRRDPWNTERRVWNEPTLTEFQSDLSQQLMGWRSGQVRFYCIIEQSARGASVPRHHHMSACNSLLTAGWHMTWSWHTWQRRHSSDNYRVINIDCGSSLLRLSPLTTLTHQGSIHAATL